MSEITIGILGVQGDVAENAAATQAAMNKMNQEGKIIIVQDARGLAGIDGLIIPGGESTTIGEMSDRTGIVQALRSRIESGMPVFGICAGMVLLSRNVKDRTVGETNQPLLGLLDAAIERNSFGRQRQSFEKNLDISALDITSFRGVFIRAPSVIDAGSTVSTISSVDGKTVAVMQDNILAVAFHPELTDDASLHVRFLEMVSSSSKIS